MLAKRIKKERTKKALSQLELSKIIGVSQQTIGSWEVGRTAPDPEMITYLASFFGITTDYLLGSTNIRNANKEEEQDEVTELFETLHKRPEMKALFSASKHATKEDIERTIKIIEALKK